MAKRYRTYLVRLNDSRGTVLKMKSTSARQILKDFKEAKRMDRPIALEHMPCSIKESKAKDKPARK